MHSQGRPLMRGGYANIYGAERNWEEGYDPRVEQFYNASFNTYTSGPGAYLPRTQQPFNRRQRDQSIPYTLFVTNFNPSTLEDGLLNVFSMYGNPLKIDRKKDKHNNPIAFVEFATQREADAAIAGLNGKPPLGWWVTYARDRLNDSELIDEIIEAVDSRLGLSRLGYDTLHQAMRSAASINGQPSVDYYDRLNVANRDYPPCIRCGFKAPYTCRYCPTRYCGKECQHQDWPMHKRQCQPPPPLVVADLPEPGSGHQMDCRTGAIPRERIIELPARASRIGHTPSNAAARPHIEVQQLQNSLSRLDIGDSVPPRGPAPFHNENQSRAASTLSPILRDRVVYPDSATPTLALTGIKPLDDYVRKQSSQSPSQNSRRSASRVNETLPSTPNRAASREQAVAIAPEDRSVSQQSNRVLHQHRVNNPAKSPRSNSSAPAVAHQPAPAPVKPALKKFAKAFTGDALGAGIKSSLAVVCFVKSPDEVYVQLDVAEPALRRVKTKIEESVCESPPLLNPTEGHPCLAIFEGLWYRAVVLKLLHRNDVGVRYVDYGNTARIANSIETLRMMETELSTEPFCATRVKLAGVVPARNNEWDNESRVKLKEWAEFQSFNMQCVETDGNVLTVTLKKAETGEDAAEFLIANKLANPLVKTAPIAAVTSPAPRAQPFSDAHIVSGSQPPTTGLVFKPQPVSGTSSQRNVSSPVRAPVSVSSDSPSVFDSLKPGDTVDYVVGVPFDSARRISIGSVLKDQEAIQRILNFHDFVTEAFSRNSAPANPITLGDIVAAHSPQHNQWFRAYVLSSKPDQSSYCVLYVDFGNEEDVTNVKPLPAGFKEPCLSVKLTFNGAIGSDMVADVNQRLKADAIQKLIITSRSADGSLLATMQDIFSDQIIGHARINSWKSLVKFQLAEPNVKAVQKTAPSVANSVQKPTPLPTPTKKPAPIVTRAQTQVQRPAQAPAQTTAQNYNSPAPTPTPTSTFVTVEQRPPPTPVRVPSLAPQIPPYTWQTEKSCPVVVITANDLDSFWVQPVTEEILQNIDDIQTMVNDLAPKAPAFMNAPVAGSYVAAIFPDDGAFYRAKIISILNSSVGVLYVDFGNSATVTVDQIRPLPEELFKYPTCSSRIVLANVSRASGSTPAKITELLSQCVNEPYNLLVISILPDSSIQCVLSNDEGVLNEKVNHLFGEKPVTGLADENSPAAETAVTVSDVPELVEAEPTGAEAPAVDNSVATVVYDDGPFLDLPESGSFQALVLNCLSPQSMQICLADDGILPKLDKLKEEMTNYAQGYMIGFTPAVGEVCMVRHQRPVDPLPYWYRGACLQINDEGGIRQFLMVLVDLGDLFLADVDDLRRIPKRFIDFIPFVAQQAVLRDVQDMEVVNELLCKRVAELLPVYAKTECQVVGHDGAACIVDIPSVAEVLRSERLI